MQSTLRDSQVLYAFSSNEGLITVASSINLQLPSCARLYYLSREPCDNSL